MEEEEDEEDEEKDRADRRLALFSALLCLTTSPAQSAVCAA